MPIVVPCRYCLEDGCGMWVDRCTKGTVIDLLRSVLEKKQSDPYFVRAEELEKLLTEELWGYLNKATEWAHVADYTVTDGWSCIRSTRAALREGRLFLALTRWDDLLQKPELVYDTPANIEQIESLWL